MTEGATPSAPAPLPRSTNPNEGRAHFHSWWVIRLILVLFTGALSLIGYAFLLRHFQERLADAYQHGPILIGILDEGAGRTTASLLRRPDGVDQAGLYRAAQNGQPAPFFIEAQPPAAIDLFEVLQTLGLVGPDDDMASVTDQAAQQSEETAATRFLFDELKAVTNKQPLKDIAAPWLAASLAGRVGNALAGNADGQLPEVCWEGALTQALADLPGRAEAWVRSTRENITSGSHQTCPPEFTTRPGILAYALRWSGQGRSVETDLTRALLLTAGVFRGVDEQASQPADERIMASTKAHALELLIRRLLERARALPSVQEARFWVNMCLGWVQWLLLWTSLALVALLFARVAERWRLAGDIRRLDRWLDDRMARLGKPDRQARQRWADDLDRELEGHIGGAEPAPDGLQQVRRTSLALLMASKAVKRLLVGVPQPGLFRDFCGTQRNRVDESAWLLRYLSRALPALGFIGTVLGILFGLDGAADIVRATFQEDRAAAMAAVTGPLALAFSTTLYALCAGLVTGLLTDWETARERFMLLAFEETLVERIDPAEMV